MQTQPGYPLPAGELGDDDIVCQLVFLPDRPEYWQAFISALHYFATWRAWERDTARRGKDAAGDWRIANELTMECWRMACLQDLQDNVAEILAIMQLGNQCCDEQDITDGDRYTDRVEDGVGDVPQNIIDAGYASGVADWDGFDDYKCMIVHVTVNQMEARLREIAEVVDSAGPYLAVAAALSAIIGVVVATGGLAIVFGIVAGIGVVSALYFALLEFESIAGLADDVATNHDELACAMYNADGDEGSLVALNDKIDELFSVPEAAILKNLNNGPTLKSLYAGRYDQQDIANELLDAGYVLTSFNCECIVEDMGDWELYYYQEKQVTEYIAPPNCTNLSQGAYVDYWVGPGPNKTGTFTIKGWIEIIGKYDLHSGCIDNGQMKLKIWQDADWNEPQRAGGSPTWINVFLDWGNYPTGDKNERHYFEIEKYWSNVKYLSYNRAMEAKYGDIDLSLDLHIYHISVVE